MLNFLRFHWFDLGLVLAAAAVVYILLASLSPLALVLWLSLVSLFLHQVEEYRYPGYFPGMINVVMFSSTQPDRYPLNPNSALIINTLVGWGSYILAAAFGERFLWLAIASILISLGNFIAHTFLFNIKGGTRYNPGMLTAILLFLPISTYFFIFLAQTGQATTLDWVLGVVLGLALNVLGIFKMIDWLKLEDSPYVFPRRFLMPDR